MKIKMVHDGDVHRARVSPANPFFIATKSPKADVLLFDYSKHPSNPENTRVCRAQARLTGHTEGGYAISWNPHSMQGRGGYLASGSSDGTICVWDIERNVTNHNSNNNNNNTPLITPIHILTAANNTNNHNNHSESSPKHAIINNNNNIGIEDVDWSKHHSDLLGSIGNDGQLRYWDLRMSSIASSAAETQNTQTTSYLRTSVPAYPSEANCLSFNPYNEYLVATGANSGLLKFWDSRNLGSALHTVEAHQGQGIYNLTWSPLEESVLATCGEDRRLMVWYDLLIH
jgi:WD40 repeat protein